MQGLLKGTDTAVPDGYRGFNQAGMTGREEMMTRSMIGRADLLMAMAAGIDLDKAAEFCGFERRKDSEPKDEQRMAILAALKSTGRLDVAADAMDEFDERAGADRQGGENEVSSDVPRLGASNHRKD